MKRLICSLIYGIITAVAGFVVFKDVKGTIVVIGGLIIISLIFPDRKS